MTCAQLVQKARQQCVNNPFSDVVDEVIENWKSSGTQRHIAFNGQINVEVSYCSVAQVLDVVLHVTHGHVAIYRQQSNAKKVKTYKPSGVFKGGGVVRPPPPFGPTVIFFG